MSEASAIPDRLPRVVGPARLTRRLGAGGAGTVYAAILESSVGAASAGDEVAVKVIRRETLDGKGLERVRREAAIGASLDHPAVVRPHGLVEAQDGGRACHLLVMELVRGTTLRELIAEMGTIPEPLLRHLVVQLAGALAAMHSRGIVHRDVKPENVLIDGAHQVKLTDMGIARSVEESAALTTTGGFVGSFAYASPEHLGTRDVVPASDLYSLGIVLYEATSGRRPFDESSVAGLVRQHLERRPRGLGEVATQCSAFLEEIVACLLEKDPGKRVASGVELAEILGEAEASAWWRARSGEPVGEAPKRRPRADHETAFVGRDAEMKLARDAVSRGLAGEGAVLLIEGEAGVGKSRLAEEILEHALDDEAIAPMVLRADADAGMGRGAIAEALVAHFGETRLRDALSRHLAATPTVVPLLAAWLLGARAAEGEGVGRDALQSALTRLVLSMSRERPLAWLVHDVHRASAQDRALALVLARAASRERIVVIATTRGEPAADAAAWDRLGAKRLAVPRLSPREVIVLLEGLFGSRRLAEEMGGRVAAKSDGNPYFVVEIARDLKQRGVVTRTKDGTWTAKQRIASFEVPSSVRSLLLERLSAVSHDERAILDAASVQGFRFDGDLVARVLGASRLSVLQSLAVLERRFRLVRATGAAYEFDHHQLQEVLLDSIPAPLRVEYHALAARALVEREGLVDAPAEGDLALRLVRHALGGMLPELAARHLRAALDHLRTRLEFDATIDLARLALARVPERSREAAIAGTRLALALEKVAKLDEAQHAASAALEAAAAQGDSMLEGQARQALVAALFHRNEYPAARAMSLLGLEASRRSGDRFTEGKILGALGIVEWFCGNLDAAEENLRASVRTLEELGTKGNLAVSLGNLATVLRTSRRPGADELYDRSIRVAVEAGELGHAALMEGNLGSMLLERCDWERGTQHVLRSLERSRQAGMLRTECGNLQRLVDKALVLGDLDEAERLIAETIAVSTAASDLRVLAQAHAASGEIARARGRLDDAARQVDLGIETYRQARAKAELVLPMLRRARIALEAGDRERARTIVGEARALAPKDDAHVAAWSSHVGLAEPPPDDAVATLPSLLRLEALALLGRDADARALADSLAAPLDAAARERFMTWGAGRHAAR